MVPATLDFASSILLPVIYMYISEAVALMVKICVFPKFIVTYILTIGIQCRQEPRTSDWKYLRKVGD